MWNQLVKTIVETATAAISSRNSTSPFRIFYYCGELEREGTLGFFCFPPSPV